MEKQNFPLFWQNSKCNNQMIFFFFFQGGHFTEMEFKIIVCNHQISCKCSPVKTILSSQILQNRWWPRLSLSARVWPPLLKRSLISFFLVYSIQLLMVTFWVLFISLCRSRFQSGIFSPPAFNISYSEGLMATNSFIFFECLKMPLFHLHFWRMFSLNIEF